MARLSRRNRKRLVSEINVVPYIDVMLVLLVIFMVTAPMLTPGVPIELPEASTDPLPVDTDEEPLIVSMNGTGELFINVGGNGETPVTLGVSEGSSDESFGCEAWHIRASCEATKVLTMEQ